MNAEPDEREWWAAREIKHLRAINAELLAALEAACPYIDVTGPRGAMAWAIAHDAIAKAKAKQ